MTHLKTDGFANKKIALFMPALSGGGAARIMLCLADEFSTRGYSVDFIVTRAEGSFVDEIPKSVRLIDLGASRIIKALPKLAQYLKREKPETMLSALASANCLCVWAKGLSGVKTRLVLSEHSTLSAATAASTDWRSRLMPLIMRLSYKHADEVIAVSKGVANDLSNTIKLTQKNITVIYNPVVTNKLTELSYEYADHQWLHNDIPVILGVGRLIPAKDFKTLIKAFSEVRRVFEAKLIILGDGEDRNTLEDLIYSLNLQQDVSLPGFVKNPYPFMRNSNVFVLSSRWEGLPTVLIEAMACNTAVISTDCPSGPREILEEGRWGELVQVGNSNEMAQTISNILKHDKHNTNARIDIFSTSHTVDHYLKILIPNSGKNKSHETANRL